MKWKEISPTLTTSGHYKLARFRVMDRYRYLLSKDDQTVGYFDTVKQAMEKINEQEPTSKGRSSRT